MKIGIIGLGARISALTTYLKQSMPEADFVCFSDLSDKPPGLPFLEASNNGKTPKSYSTPEEMLANEELDMLMIGSPNDQHLGHIETALKSNIQNIFVEKPVVTTIDESFKLLQLMKDHNGMERLMVGLVLRYSPLYRELRSAKDNNILGDITSIEASELIPPHHGQFYMRDWRRNTGASGGFMLEKCVHDLDLYSGLLGCRPMQVASFGGKKTFVPSNKPNQDLPKPDVQGRLYPYEPRFNGAKDAFNSDADIIDYQTAIIQYENGTSLSFHTNLNAPDESRHFKVMGNKAMAQGDFVKNNFQLHDSVTYKCLIDHQQVDQAGTGHYGADAAMVEDLVDHMKNGTPLPVSILDALEAGICAIKIDEARTSQTVIDLTMTWDKFDSYKLREGHNAPTTAQLSPSAIRAITP